MGSRNIQLVTGRNYGLPVLLPRWMTIASAVNFAVQTGRKKLMLSSIVVNDWPGSRARERHSHGRIRQIAQNSSVQRSHGIGMLRAGLERSHGSAACTLRDIEADQIRDGKLARGSGLRRRLRTKDGTFLLRKLAHDTLVCLDRPRFARTLCSKY